MESLLKEDNYYVVQGYMAKELHLKGNELVLYAIIKGFSQTEGQNFTGSLRYLEEWTNSSKMSIISNLKSLCEKGLIEKIEIIRNGVKFCEYKTLPVVKKVYWGGKESLPNNKDIYNKDEKEIYKEKESFKICEQVVDKCTQYIDNNKFIPPTLEEIKEYAKENKHQELAEDFYKYFTVGKWIDSNGKKVRNWKQKFITWVTFREKKAKSISSEREYTKDDFEGFIQDIDKIEI